MSKHKAVASLFLGLLIFTMALIFPFPAAAQSPTYTAKFRAPAGTCMGCDAQNSIDEFDIGQKFYVDIELDTGASTCWVWQVGIRFNPAVLKVNSLGEATLPAAAWMGFMAGTINNPGGYVGPSSDTLTAYPEVSGVFDVMWFEFEVVGYGTSTIDLTSFSPPDNDMQAGSLIGTKTNGGVQEVALGPLTDVFFDNTGLELTPYSPTAVITQKTPEPHYVGDTIELYGGDSLSGFDGTDPSPIVSWFWDFENDGIIDDMGVTVFWNTSGYLPGNYDVNLTVYAPGGPTAGQDYNATMQYSSIIDTKTLYTKEGDHHDDHLNDPTDDFPNDYAPMVIPVDGKDIVIAPVITCTTLENDVFKPFHHPCKLAQTILADNDWGDGDANYTYAFEDWTDYDWNDIVVSLYAITNDVITVEIRLVDREAAWKNPFGVEITPEGLTVDVHWNSTDCPGDHIVRVNSNETEDIELLGESNPGDTAFIMIITLVPQTYTLTVTSTSGGTTDPVPDSYSYNEGTVVSVTAIPDSSYILDHWELDKVDFGSTNPINVTIDSDHTLHAVFEETQAVGGRATPIDKPYLLVPKISLTSRTGFAFVLLGAMAATVILIRRKKRH